MGEAKADRTAKIAAGREIELALDRGPVQIIKTNLTMTHVEKIGILRASGAVYG